MRAGAAGITVAALKRRLCPSQGRGNPAEANPRNDPGAVQGSDAAGANGIAENGAALDSMKSRQWTTITVCRGITSPRKVEEQAKSSSFLFVL